MRLLLDEMFPAAIAEQLRARGCDALAVQAMAELRELADPALFAAAQALGRAVVSDNVRDFLPLALRGGGTGSEGTHFGLVLTTNRSLPRHSRALIGLAVRRLAPLCREHPDAATGLVVWVTGTLADGRKKKSTGGRGTTVGTLSSCALPSTTTRLGSTTTGRTGFSPRSESIVHHQLDPLAEPPCG